MAIGLQKRRNDEKEEMPTESVEDLSDAQNRNPMAVVIVVAVVIIVVIIMVSVLLSRDKDSDAPHEEGIGTESEEEEAVVSNGVYDADGMTLNPDGINPGIGTAQASDTTSATVYSPDDFIKDLNGLDISAVYEVGDISYVYDYVSYEKRRALIDDGMELYWLEAEYQGKKYRIEIPFTYFKNLRSSGICRVMVEVLTLKNGGKVISYMRYEGETE